MTGSGDDESDVESPVGAAKAERDEEDEAPANDARSKEELDGSFMANGTLRL